MTENVKKIAPDILSLIKSSTSVLLHCHPSPDPDSVGSALAMKLALESLGKKVTVIAGDSEIPKAFSHFPGFASIVPKNFFEIDLAAFDLFIIQDSGSPEMISRKSPMVDGAAQPIIFPSGLKTVVIDHHISNKKFANDINLVDETYPSTTLLLLDLFKEWGIVITPDIAADLYIGAFTDTGGFRYENTTAETLLAASELARSAPHFLNVVSQMENSRTPAELIVHGIALSNIEIFADVHMAIASVTLADLEKRGIAVKDASSGGVAGQLKSVIGWDIGICIVEIEPGLFKGSMRTRDSEKYDLSKLALTLGGGGHKAAAGIRVKGTLASVKQQIVDAARAML